MFFNGIVLRKFHIGDLITEYGKDLKDIGIFEIFRDYIKLNILHIVIIFAFPTLHYNIIEHLQVSWLYCRYLIKYIGFQLQKNVLLLCH